MKENDYIEQTTPISSKNNTNNNNTKEFQLISNTLDPTKLVTTPNTESENTDKNKKFKTNLNFQQTTTQKEDAQTTLQTKIQPKNLYNKLSLSSSSKFLLILRIIIICLFCIYISLETILFKRLERVENKTIFNKHSKKFIHKKVFKHLSNGFKSILGNKYYIQMYINIVYILFHPFLALKFATVTTVVFYLVVLLQCFYQSQRPFWLKSNKNYQPNFCSSNYAFPSGDFFLGTFFPLYLIVSFRLLNKQKNFNICQRILYHIFYFILIVILGGVLLLNDLHYVYQLMSSLVISLISICILIDLDNYIHNFLLKSLKNTFKTRKYKMRIFFYVLSLSLFSIIIYFFIPEDDLNEVEQNLTKFKVCSNAEIDQLGKERTFSDLSYIFSIIGAFWGASNTIEFDCSAWWENDLRNSIVKAFVTLGCSVIYIVAINYINLSAFELNFVINILKCFFHFFLIMGFLPLLFEKIGLNSPKENINDDITDDNNTNEDEEMNSINSGKKNKNDIAYYGGDKNNNSNSNINTHHPLIKRQSSSQLFTQTIFSQKFTHSDVEFLFDEIKEQNKPLLDDKDVTSMNNIKVNPNVINNNVKDNKSKSNKDVVSYKDKNNLKKQDNVETVRTSRNEKNDKKKGGRKDSLLVRNMEEHERNDNLQFFINSTSLKNIIEGTENEYYSNDNYYINNNVDENNKTEKSNDEKALNEVILKNLNESIDEIEEANYFKNEDSEDSEANEDKKNKNNKNNK